MRGLTSALWVCCCWVTLPHTASAATFAVTSSADSGVGSFRQAILDANASAGADLVDCQLTAATPIVLVSGLPDINGDLTISGAGCVLDGQNVPGLASGLSVSGNNVVLRDLVIHSFPGTGIWIAGGDNIIVQGNLIGLGPDGLSGLGNGEHGIGIDGSTNVVLGAPLPLTSVPSACGIGTSCNVLGGNSVNGLSVRGAFDTLTIAGNFFGSDVAGLMAVSNSGRSISVDETGTRLLVSHNLMLGSTGDWHVVVHSDDSAVIEGNYIGTDRTGNVIPAGASPLARGIYVSSLSGAFPVVGPVVRDNTLCGLETALQFGEYARDASALGNRIGLGADGTTILGGVTGISISDAERIAIGDGTDAGANRIQGLADAPLFIGGTSRQITVQRNHITSARGIPIEVQGSETNDDGDLDSGANGRLNFPIVERFSNVPRRDQFQFSGFGPAGATIECYAGSPFAGELGQAELYLGRFIEGGPDDQAAGVGAYSNAFGTETTASRFMFVAASVTIPSGHVVSCTATTVEGTSRLGPAIGITTADCNAALDCSDGSDCTVDTCDADWQCANQPLPDGTECGGGICESGLCVSCLTDGCVAGVCVTVGPNQGRCGMCNTATDCPAESPVCAPATNLCVPCSDPSAAGCPSGTTCDRDTGRCGLDPNQDSDGDGLSNGTECPSLVNCADSDADAISDYLDTDDDGDSIPTLTECPNASACTDSDADRASDYLDPDDDGDGILTRDERLDAETYGADPDLDGQQSYLDRDSDGDGSSDLIEGRTPGPSAVPAYLDVSFLGGGGVSGGALHCAVGSGGRSNVWMIVTLGLLVLVLVHRSGSKI